MRSMAFCTGAGQNMPALLAGNEVAIATKLLREALTALLAGNEVAVVATKLPRNALV